MVEKGSRRAARHYPIRYPHLGILAFHATGYSGGTRNRDGACRLRGQARHEDSLTVSEPDTPIDSKKTDSPPTGEWDVRVESSPLDDIKTIFLDLKAMDSPTVRGTSSLTPQMSFMCTGKDVEGYIFVRAPPELGRSRYATVRVRFDKLEPQTLRMEPSAKEDALFFNKPASILKQMLGHERMLFGFKPRGSEETVTEFDLRGVDEAVKPLVEACEVPELAPDEPPEPDATSSDP